MKNQPLLRRASFALAGLKAAWKSEKSVRAHVMAIVAAAVLLFFLHPRPIWWAIVSLAAGLMLTAELINTAMEKWIDHLSPEIHPDVKFIKDVLAGAVFVSCVAGGLVLLAFLCARF
jgi:undecaprenol kinase